MTLPAPAIPGGGPHSLVVHLPHRRRPAPSFRLATASPTLPTTALARQLARWQLPGADAPRHHGPQPDVAERLGQWLNVKEAIALHTAQAAAVPVAHGARPVDAAHRLPPLLAELQNELQAELQRVRAVLGQSIQARASGPALDPDEPDTAFALMHQHLQDQQRRMALSVDALRAHVRQRLAQYTPAHARLAALDQQMEQLFGGREQRLLSTLPSLLKARFAALRREAASSVDGDASARPEWLASFESELEQTLLAELELRLLPVVGLIESLPA